MRRFALSAFAVRVLVALVIFLVVGVLDEAKGRNPLATRLVEWVCYTLTSRTSVREAYAETRGWVSTNARSLWPDLRGFSTAGERGTAPPGEGRGASGDATGPPGDAGETMEGQTAGGQTVAMAAPCDGVVTRGFGVTAHPILKLPLKHSGIDISAATGTPVRAVLDGRVIEAAYKGTYGRTVVLSHAGGLTTSYSHLSRMEVAAGQDVAQGQTVGLVGSTGLSTGPHLHFEVRRSGVACDPAGFLPAL